jgi:RNA polymerase sigma factor (sigma-70 family)
MNTSPVKIDPLLEPFLTELDDTRADELLLQLINHHTEPVVKGVIRYKLRLSSQSATQHAEAEDIYQETVLHLLAQLREFRRIPDKHPISDVRGMAAVIAHRACSRWMRRQFPERHALKNRLHYLLTRQRGLALWQDDDGKMLAGFAVWQEQKKAATRQISAAIEISTSRKQNKLADTVAAILNHAGGPLELDDLVSSAATVLGIRDQPMESLAEDEDSVALLPADEPDPEWQIEKRIFLQRLWEELQQLPINQRAALLLNLKDNSGRGCITLFPVTGTATVRQLAAALEINVDKFASIWNELPLEDARIAELLGLTRQQVINARKSGRERLARRLKGFF